MEENHFIAKKATPIPWITHWEAPSNIALIKYWGKTTPQIPKNPSLSFTLSYSVTQTQVVFEPASPGAFDFNFYFEGVAKPDFKPKLQTFFKRIESYIPWIQGYQLTIKSHNTFPHSSGIASSASAMAALAMCLMDLEQKLVPDLEPEFFHQKASFLARLGSGSAARSIQGPVTLWGVNKMQDRSSNLYAIPFGLDLHPVFSTYQDAILLVDKASNSTILIKASKSPAFITGTSASKFAAACKKR